MQSEMPGGASDPGISMPATAVVNTLLLGNVWCVATTRSEGVGATGSPPRGQPFLSRSSSATIGARSALQLRAVCRPRLAQEALQVGLDRRLDGREPVGYISARRSVGDHGQHLEFSRR